MAKTARTTALDAGLIILTEVTLKSFNRLIGKPVEGRWTDGLMYPGVLTAVDAKHAKPFLVKWDDDTETRTKMVRELIEEVVAPRGKAKATETPNYGPLIGKDVEALWPADGRWYPARLVSLDHTTGKAPRFTVEWHDGGEQEQVKQVRPLPAPVEPKGKKAAPKATPAPAKTKRGPAADKARKAAEATAVAQPAAEQVNARYAPKAKRAEPKDPKAATLELVRLAAEAVAAKAAAKKEAEATAAALAEKKAATVAKRKATIEAKRLAEEALAKAAAKAAKSKGKRKAVAA